MRILIVAATSMELAPIVAGLHPAGNREPRVEAYTCGGHQIDVVTTGVGMVATAAWCSRVLAQARYDVSLNAGVCGSFDPEIRPGQVVHVVSDRIAELGVEDGDTFLPIDQLDLPAEYECSNPAPPRNRSLEGLRAVSGLTVNTVHGSERSIAEAVRRFNPQVETMEGAAFMYACTIGGVAFAQIRAVSNVVERRNRGAWKMAEAVDALGRTVLDVVRSA